MRVLPAFVPLRWVRPSQPIRSLRPARSRAAAACVAVLAVGVLGACGPGAQRGAGVAEDRALRLDGDAWVEFADRGDVFDLVPGGERTFALWLRYDRPQYHAKILSKSSEPDSAGWQGFAAFVHQYSTSFGFWHRTMVPLDESGFTQDGTAGTRRIGDGAWHFVALVQRDTLVEGWVDGRLEFVENVALTLPRLANDQPMYLGWYHADVVRFAGEMDDFSVWSRALSGRELRRLRFRSPLPDAPGLTGYWPMDEGEGSRVVDRSEHGLDGVGVALSWAPASRPGAPPFRERIVFYVLLGLAIVSVYFGSIWLYGRRLEHQKRTLEGQVAERVRDLARTNAEKTEALELVASQAARLREVDGARRRFLTDIAHEFRTPLSLIVAPLSDALAREDSDLRPDVADAIRSALRSGRRLGHLTTGLLELARVEAQALQLDRQPLDLAEFLGELSRAFEVAAAREGVHLEVDTPDHALVLLADPDRLETIFGNLLANAIRFTPHGGSVSFRIRREGSDASVEVRDDGPGIPNGDHARIFERFVQTPLGVARGGGTGIGLALVKELVELHGGRVDLTSEVGKGATFRVVLPLADDPDLSPVPSAIRHPAEGFSLGADGPATPALHGSLPATHDRIPDEADHAVGHDSGTDADVAEDSERTLPPLILVVEDHAGLRSFLRGHLARQFRVVDAPDGRAGFDLARERAPDVVVADVMMPEVDGLELLTLLREDPELASTPVILLTARADLADRLAGLERGADDYLAKPFEPLELAARIKSVLGTRQRLRDELLREMAEGGDTVDGDADMRGPDPADDLRARLRQSIEERIADPDFGVSELAATVAMERTGLYRQMTEELGVTPSEFVREIRLERAAGLLQAGHTVSSVAYAVGYGSVSSFSRRFQGRFGIRPGGWARASEGSAR